MESVFLGRWYLNLYILFRESCSLLVLSIFLCLDKIEIWNYNCTFIGILSHVARTVFYQWFFLRFSSVLKLCVLFLNLHIKFVHQYARSFTPIASQMLTNCHLPSLFCRCFNWFYGRTTQSSNETVDS